MKALLLVDIQNDFLPNGALGIANGDEILPVVNKLLKSEFDVCVASQDWHPADHVSFAANHDREVGELVDVDGLQQVLWPVHCVQGERGAELSDALDTSAIEYCLHKGTNSAVDSYSTFFDNGRRHKTELTDYLRERGVSEVYIVGLATDYCVKFSALDAVDEGFDVKVVVDACRGVDLTPGDVDAALAEMESAGVELVTSDAVLATLTG